MRYDASAQSILTLVVFKTSTTTYICFFKLFLYVLIQFSSPKPGEEGGRNTSCRLILRNMYVGVLLRKENEEEEPSESMSSRHQGFFSY